MSDYGLADAVRAGDLLFVSGQTSFPDLGDLAAQLRGAYAKITRILDAHGLTLADVVDETVFVLDATAWATVADVRRDVYAGRFEMASTLVQVAGFPVPGMLVEVKVVAVSR